MRAITIFLLSIAFLFASDGRCAGFSPTADGRGLVVEFDPREVLFLRKSMDLLGNEQAYTPEQRKLSNYKMRLVILEKEVKVSFLAIARKGDLITRGGNYDYAQTTIYTFDIESGELLKTEGTR